MGWSLPPANRPRVPHPSSAWVGTHSRRAPSRSAPEYRKLSPTSAARFRPAGAPARAGRQVSRHPPQRRHGPLGRSHRTGRRPNVGRSPRHCQPHSRRVPELVTPGATSPHHPKFSLLPDDPAVRRPHADDRLLTRWTGHVNKTPANASDPNARRADSRVMNGYLTMWAFIERKHSTCRFCSQDASRKDHR